MMASSAERDSLGRTPLHVAAEKDDLKAAESLIAAGADIDAKDNDGNTPLMQAVAFGNLAITKLLINAGANLEAKEKDGETPLHVAVNVLNLEAARLLIDAGANVDAEDRYIKTPLHYAAKDSKLEIARLLIEKGVNVKAGDINGDTPLHLVATGKGGFQIARLLIDAGADVNAKDKNGVSPLHTAVEKERLNFVIFLIEEGANVDAGDIDGYTPLHFVAENNLLKTISLLIDAGANVDAEANDGKTPLHVAVQEESFEVLNLLIDAGANVDAVDKKGRPPLFLAARVNSLKSAKLLIDAGAKVNLGQPLLEVATLGNVAITRLLVRKGADINARHSSSGKTALHYAVKSGQPEIAQLLAKSGADVNIKDNDGKLFWEYAEDEDFSEKMEALYERYRFSDRAKKLSELRGSGGSSKEIEELSKMSDKEFEDLVGGRAMDECTNKMDVVEGSAWLASDFRNTVFLRVTDKFGKQRTFCMVEKFYDASDDRKVESEVKENPMLKVLRARLEQAKQVLQDGFYYKENEDGEKEKVTLSAQDRVEREQRRVGLESQITTLSRLNPNQEHKGKKKGKDRERTISDSFKGMFFSDWVYRFDAGSEAERSWMHRTIEEERWAERDRLRTLERISRRNRLEKDAAKELAQLRLRNAQRNKLGQLQYKDNRTADEEARLLQLGKRFNGLLDKDHKAGDAYSSADAYGRSGKGGRPGKKRYVKLEFANGANFYVEWDARLKKVVKRERAYVDDENYRGGRREAYVPSFKLPDKWSLPIAIYIKQEEEPVAIGNEEGSSGSSRTHGNRTVSVYKVTKIVNFETYDSIDRQRECLGCSLLYEAIDVDSDEDEDEDEFDVYDDVEALIEKGEDVNVKLADKSNKFPLYVAVEKSFSLVTRLLLENGANVNAKEIHGETAIHVACRYAEIDILDVLLEFGADVNIQDNEGQTPLHYTVENGATEIAEWLIKNGADPYIKNKKGNTFFQEALGLDEDDLDRLAIVYAETRGTNLLFRAITAKRTSEEKIYASVEALLEKGEDPNSMDVQQLNHVLDYAVHKSYVTVTRLLLEKGADVNIKNYDGKTSLHSVSEYTGAEFVTLTRLLLEFGADVNMQDDEGRTPLHTAFDVDIVKLLLEFGANPNIQDIRSQTPLHTVRNVDIVKLLLEIGANPNIQDFRGQTPLHYTVENGATEIAEWLIKNGADPYIKNKKGETFFDRVPDVKVRERMEKVFAKVKGKRKRPAASLADGVDKLKF